MPNTNMTKTQWVKLFRETGLNEATIRPLKRFRPKNGRGYCAPDYTQDVQTR